MNDLALLWRSCCWFTYFFGMWSWWISQVKPHGWGGVWRRCVQRVQQWAKEPWANNKNVSGKKMTLFYHDVSLQLYPLRTCHWIVCQTCLFFFCACCSLLFIQQQLFSFPKTLYYWAKVKFCLLLCLDFELNADKDIKLQPTTLQLDHHSFTKTSQRQKCVCLCLKRSQT